MVVQWSGAPLLSPDELLKSFVEAEVKSELDDLYSELRAMIPCSSPEDEKAKKKHIGVLVEAIEGQTELLECLRVAKAVNENDELHPPPKEDCPICLEPTRTDVTTTFARLPCCGGFTCVGCVDKDKVKKCPLCRATFRGMGEQGETYIRALREHADNGKSWAQLDLGQLYQSGQFCPIDLKEAVKWYELAAIQENGPALCHLGTLYFLGSKGIVKQSYAKAWEYMLASSRLGISEAHSYLGIMKYHGYGTRRDTAEAARYFTLSVGQANYVPLGQESKANEFFFLGLMFSSGEGGLEKSLVRAKYYFEKAAESDLVAAYFHLSFTLMEFYQEHFGTVVMPGHSCIPRALFLMRKAAVKKFKGAAKAVEALESQAGSLCAHCCNETDSITEELKKCKRCRGAYYCGRTCQLAHWREGHKIDCIDCS